MSVSLWILYVSYAHVTLCTWRLHFPCGYYAFALCAVYCMLQVAAQGVEALMRGDRTVVPGWQNKLYVHVITPLVSEWVEAFAYPWILHAYPSTVANLGTTTKCTIPFSSFKASRRREKLGLGHT